MIAVHDVSLEMRHEHFVCLLGPSGCGKSTLLNMIAGFVMPTSGRILVDDRPVTGPGRDRGVVFQEYALFPWRTALQNAEFGPLVRGVPGPERRSIAERYLALVGLGEHLHKYPRELSGGMKQRVAIARALANDPAVLLMDEPFGALDAQTREVMQEELLKIWLGERKTIAFVTHSISESIYLADDVVVMTARPGRIKEIVRVDLPRPRERGSPEFTAIARHVERLVKEEVRKAGLV
jgi:NitT/TauT family transport system ATP-binding protein